jgi:hypothetical protein
VYGYEVVRVRSVQQVLIHLAVSDTHLLATPHLLALTPRGLQQGGGALLSCPQAHRRPLHGKTRLRRVTG